MAFMRSGVRSPSAPPNFLITLLKRARDGLLRARTNIQTVDGMLLRLPASPISIATSRSKTILLMFLKQIAKLAIRFGLIVIAIVLCLEVLMIVLDPYLFKGLFEYDSDLGFRARAHFPNGWGTLTNQFGFNDRDYPLEKSPGGFRILVLGDSFGWAGGLDGNYTALLERMFESRDGSHRVDVIDAGYPGTHTGEQLAALKKYGLQYNPDLVILGFFAGNDFFEADPNRKRIVVNECFVDIDKRHEHRFLGYPIITKSRTFLFLKEKYDLYRRTKTAQREAQEWAAATGHPAPEKNLPEDVFLKIQNAKLAFFNQKISARRFGPNIDYIFQSISELNELLKSRNIKFMVAIYPDEMQVSPNQFETLVAKFGLNREEYNLNLAEDRLKPFLESKQIPYLDLLDRFRTEEQKRDLYLFRNTHWNEAGNQLAAEMLFQYLLKQPYDLNSRK
jgi:hypothetical protein